MDKKSISEHYKEIGKRGGQSKSPAKLAAIARNAQNAGRPPIPEDQMSYAQKKRRERYEAQKKQAVERSKKDQMFNNLVIKFDDLCKMSRDNYSWNWTLESYYNFLFQESFPGVDNLTTDQLAEMVDALDEDIKEKAIS